MFCWEFSSRNFVSMAGVKIQRIYLVCRAIRLEPRRPGHENKTPTTNIISSAKMADTWLAQDELCESEACQALVFCFHKAFSGGVSHFPCI